MSALNFGAGNTTRRLTTSNTTALPSTGWAVVAWVRHRAADVTVAEVLVGFGTSGAASSCQLRTFGAPSQYGIQARDASGSNISAGAAFPADGDYLLVGQFDAVGGALEYYCVPSGGTASGAADGSGASYATIAPGSAWYIGSDGTSWTQTPLGEVAVVGRSLTLAEINALAQGEPITDVEAPLLYWQLRSGAQTTEPNLGSAASGDATFVGTGYTTETDFFVIGQKAVPDSDVSAGAWTPSSGSDLYALLADASDSTYDSATSNTTMRVGLQALSTPDYGTQTVAFRASGSPAKKLIVRLIEGASTVRGSTTVDPLTSTVTGYTFSPSGITDYGDLDLEFEVTDATTQPGGPSYQSLGTAATGTTSCTPSYPSMTGATSATALYLLITGRSNTASTAPAITGGGWTLVGQLEGGTGTWAADTGTRRVDVYRKTTVSGSESGTITVTLSGSANNTLRAQIMRIDPPVVGYTLTEAWASGADTSNGTGYSATASSSIAFAPNDLLITVTAQNIDTGTGSSRSITASGITFGTLTNRADDAVTNGNQHRAIINTAPISSGTATVAPTYAYTISASGSGPTGFMCIRAVAPSEFARVAGAKFTLPAASTSNNGALARTLVAAALAAMGAVDLQAALSRTLASASSASAASLAVSGTAAPTLLNAALSASGGAPPISGMAALALTSAAAESAGMLTLSGLATPPLAPATLVAVSSLPLSAQAASTLLAASIASAGGLSLTAEGAIVLAPASAAALAALGLSGQAAAILAPTAIGAAGTLMLVGNLAAQLGASELLAAGNATPSAGDLSVQLAHAVLGAGGTLPIAATAAPTLSRLFAVAQATLPLSGALDRTLAAALLASSGGSVRAAMLDVVLAHVALDATGYGGELSIIDPTRLAMRLARMLDAHLHEASPGVRHIERAAARFGEHGLNQ